jgi:hypothetical protein
MTNLPALGLFHVDPAEKVLPADALEEGRMVGGHVPADGGDHLIVGVAPGDIAALASDDPGHRVLLIGLYAGVVDRMLA